MTLFRIWLVGWFLLCSFLCYGQTKPIRGKVLHAKDSSGIADVLIQIPELDYRTLSNERGEFTILVDQAKFTQLYFSHIDFTDRSLSLKGRDLEKELFVYLQQEKLYLNQVDVTGGREQALSDAALQKLPPIKVNELATPFNEFSQLVATLPGVVSNNELSSAYAVRGGNFDENLVYVNGMEVYRPFLIRAGQQEGLSFINPDMVSSVNFSAGGWENKYGDKLSSNLLVNYGKYDSIRGNVNLGLLGASGFVGTPFGNDGSLAMGVRYKNARYLFNTFETDGQYLPRFVDFQLYYTQKLSSKTSIDVLANLAQNDYLVRPETRETDFGTFQNKIRFLVFYDGSESLSYRTGQIGLRLTHLFNDNFKSSVNFSAFQTSEYEYRNLEGFYRLCDVDRDLSSDTFDQCIAERGAGSDFQYARNILDAQVVQLINRNDLQLQKDHLLAFGINVKRQWVNDLINEYAFKDSSDFIQVQDVVNRENRLTADFLNAYVQHEWQIDPSLFLNYGFRLNYGSNTNEFHISPRLQLQKTIFPDKSGVLSFSTGIYRQYPFYRELRNTSGELATDIRSQSALHAILSLNKDFQAWYRPFNLMVATYYKHYFHLIPYDVDNVRIRYRPELSATGYATGLDLRVSGEFIPGTESWLSVGLLSTQEDVAGDKQGLIRRPSDQRLTASIFFQDYFKDNPDLRVNLKIQLGTGLPFGPPNSIENRSAFTGEWYRRMDVGFTKRFQFQDSKKFESLILGIDVLNVLGVSNTISYTWIEDVNANNFAVPNSLSARFFNLKGILNF